MEDRLALLGVKAGPVLFQLPPSFKADAVRLASFLRLLSTKRRLPAEIECGAKSAESKVRHPFFKGLREDL
jgi:uncharacterized protein YecE (DUF72 family)